jgi:hypothetical protein
MESRACIVPYGKLGRDLKQTKALKSIATKESNPAIRAIFFTEVIDLIINH